MASIDLLTSLKTCELFKNLEDSDFYLLLHHGKLKLFSPKDFIYKRGEFAKGLFCLIMTGKVDILTENGQFIKAMEGGEVLGEIGVTSPQHQRTATVKAVQPTEIFEWNAELIGEHIPDLMERLRRLARKTTSSVTAEELPKL